MISENQLVSEVEAGGYADIVLVPPVINPLYSRGAQPFMPLGLLAVAATLREAGFHPRIFRPLEMMLTPGDYTAVAGEILKWKPRMVGFSTWCITYPASLLVARQIRIADPREIIVFGGPQASVVARESMEEFDFIDFVLAGEADYSLPELLRNVFRHAGPEELKQIPGLLFRSNGKLLQGRPQKFVARLDDLPVPAYDMVPAGKSIKLDAGRGCPFSCSFCSTSRFFSGKFRIKTAVRLLSEMNMAYEKYGITRFTVSHDLFTLNKTYISDFCNLLIMNRKNTGHGFSWTCSARIDTVTGPMLSLMKKAGCRAVFFGVETGSKRLQKMIGKNLRPEDALGLADICLKLGIEMHTSFITGFPEETDEDLELTLTCMLKLLLKGALVQISELSVLPGTPLFRDHQMNLKFDGRFSSFSESLCGMEELRLITKYPRIFSSFWYLPVDSYDRETSHLLCIFINHLSDFRNTFLLLKKLIANRIGARSLLSLFRQVMPAFRDHIRSGRPPSTFLTGLLNLEFTGPGREDIPPGTADVFAYDVARSMLLARYSRNRLMRLGNHSGGYREGRSASPDHGLPEMLKDAAWHILRTSCRLEKLLPAAEGHKPRLMNNGRSYAYFMASLSETRSVYFLLNQKEVKLIQKNFGKREGNFPEGIPFPWFTTGNISKKFARNGLCAPC